MTHSAGAIANHLLDIVKEEGHELCPMKLQKLVYFAHGWHLALADAPLVQEGIEAWRFGPVVESLYHQFKDFGDRPITRKALEVAFHDRRVIALNPSIGDDNYVADLNRRIWKVYGHYTPIQLSNMTHAPGTPWHQVVSLFPRGLPPHLRIPDELICEHFAAQLGEKVQS